MTYLEHLEYLDYNLYLEYLEYRDGHNLFKCCTTSTSEGCILFMNHDEAFYVIKRSCDELNIKFLSNI